VRTILNAVLRERDAAFPSTTARPAGGGQNPGSCPMTLPEPLQASAQHIGLLHERRRLLAHKRQRLREALVSAELQFLVALRRECEAGETSWAQLRDAYATLSAGKLRGLRARWMDAVGIPPEKVIANARAEAAGPDHRR